MNTLSLGWTDFTYEMLYNRVRARVYCDNPRQTPVLEGEVNRTFFGLNRILSFHSATVNQVRNRGSVQVGSVIELNAGHAHQIDVGTEFAICAPSTVTDPYPRAELARVRVRRIRGVVSEAEVISIFTEDTSVVDVGCSAVVIPTGTNSRKRVVKLYARPELSGNMYQHTALSQLKTCLTDTATYFIKLQENVDGPFDIRIAVNNGMEFECSDSTGQFIPNLLSPIKIFEPDASTKLVRRITHFAKFCNIRDLENPNRLSTLANKLRIEVVRNLSELERHRVLQHRNQTFQQNMHQQLQNITSVSQVMDGDTILLHIHNLSAFVVNVTVFDLDPLWQVSQILPLNGYFVEVDPGKFVPLTLTMVSGPGSWNNVDIIKAFATVQPTSFRWLELPVLEEETHHTSNVAPSNELEELCAALTEERRNQVPPMSAWDTAEVMIRVNRAGR
jgi:hypothetical protein